MQRQAGGGGRQELPHRGLPQLLHQGEKNQGLRRFVLDHQAGAIAIDAGAAHAGLRLQPGQQAVPEPGAAAQRGHLQARAAEDAMANRKVHAPPDGLTDDLKGALIYTLARWAAAMP